MFGLFERPRWTADQIPDLHGRVAIVTGANSGIGYVTALELVRHGAKTYLACRDATRAKSAIEKIKAIVPDSDPQFLKLDITSLNSAHSAAQEFLKLEKRLDILVNNAGVAFAPYQLSEDGIEIHACNATGHFAFTIPLLNLLEKTSQEPGSHVRIVNVSSNAHSWVWGTPDFSSLKNLNEHCFGMMDRYGLSKLMNILFTNELQKRLNHTKIICTSAHPGGVNTNIVTGIWVEQYPILKVFDWVKSWLLLTPEDGAINLLYGATDSEVETKDLRSAYLCPFVKVTKTSRLAQDPEGILGKQFWNFCEALVKEKVKVN
ncbi:hypothetical protein PTTG_08762 [Puccinia triticina 1-1 BBBD Race 1]|uniref:NAD(P)-binding protein n=2 Tax=Puccinia triticina TaxID=208348 RepID=A0A0C4F6J2_PUCT1|nr:uncharacterized protein PtA15_1A435 [Puccinia triticina]OAV87996.1 hypothetical protein PTTG_08762 [Puccinia triticina 1-1 BBBD Race 1]WAQ81097.1 hypothetical protein PtA15_1A435 [Puccinia triticina]WAR51990.1 hypothetical protein PtB15_1B428 [Puccinia triticina]WAR51997.1 hypothetical protein PtB15_1B435 [Puccinia triticina]